MSEEVRTLLKLVLVVLLALLFWLRLYRAVMEDAELGTLKSVPLRIVTEEDFDVAFTSMDEDKRLAVQRRSEALNWFDTDEDFQRETA